MKAFFKVLLAVSALFLVSVFAVSCGSGYKPYSFYKIAGDESVSYYHGVDFKVKYTDDTVDGTYAKEMWINIHGIDKTSGTENITFKFYCRTSSGSWSNSDSYFGSGTKATFTVENKKENVGDDGVWLRVFSNMKITSSSRTEFRILTENEIEVNQIIILDAEYNPVEFVEVTAVGGVDKTNATGGIYLDANQSKIIKSATNMFNRPEKFVRVEK